MSALGETIRVVRDRRGMSLQILADEAGLTKAHVWDLERGRSRNPTVKTILNIALALGLEPATLAATAMADVRDVTSKPIALTPPAAP